MATRPSTDQAVDDFVARFSAGGARTADAGEVPEALREGEVDERGQVRWRLARIATAPWAEALEARLPARLPPSFRSLIHRYAFPAFELGPVRLFASTGEPERRDELGTALFADRGLGEILLEHGFVQVGRPAGGGYDPVCFDLGRGRGGAERPLVQLDHEAALLRGEARVVRPVASSFLALLRDHA